MSRLAGALCLCLAAIALGGPAAANAAGWRSEQPPGPGGTPVLLGEVGDLQCWSANRCLLISAGNGGVQPGLFAYDGSSWYRYSTVCGGHEGRIAWAGPDEFWTISDQQDGHAPVLPEREAFNVSLCHFKDGQVVGSYAEPVGLPASYRHMDAAACAGPADCWFAGARLPAGSAEPGAFHLHWDGGALTAVPSPTTLAELGDPGRTVTGLAYDPGSGRFYEGVRAEADDVPNREEEELGISLVHRIEAGSPTPFKPLFGAEPFDYGQPGAQAAELAGMRLSAGEGGLWAVSGSRGPSAEVTVLRLGEAGLAQLPLVDPGSVLSGESEVAVSGLAAEPGAEAAWVAFHRPADPKVGLLSRARLARVAGDGTVGPEVTLPAAGEEVGGEPLGRKGVAGPIACAAAEQCWLATEKGWLFHLGDDPAPNADPAMHPVPPIETRPPDASLPVLPPIELPEDDSGAEKSASSQEELPTELEELPKRRPALVSKVKQNLIDGTVLLLTFTLRAKAHVRLVARRKGSVVAQTPRYTMASGRRSLRLRLDPKRWPTRLDLQAHELKKKGAK